MSTSVSCSAYNCGNSFGREGITFHRFPVDKPNLLAKWLVAMGKPKWAPTKDHFLCSEHFAEDMFNEKGGYRFVKYDAIPVQFFTLPKPKMLFPPDYSSRFLTIKEVEEDFSKGYVIEVKLGIDSEEKFFTWLNEHENVAKVKYRMLQKYPKTGKNLAFKSEYVCRQANCPAKLLVRIRLQPQKFSKPDSDLSAYPCTVVLYHLHNHRLDSNVFEVLHTLPESVTEATKQKFIEMFKGGYSPEVALTTYHSDLFEEYPDEYEKILCDPTICPEPEWVRLQYEAFISESGEWSQEKMIEALKNEISKLNAEEGKAKMEKVGDDIVVALCTPLMQRAHSLKPSSEIVFCDNSCFLSTCKCYIYALMTYSISEGLPLGILISTSCSENVLTTGFQVLTEVLPEKAFGHYGRIGPEILLTDNNEAEEKGIKDSFPESTLLLSAYNLLKGIWRWLWDAENNVEEDDRCVLYALVIKLMKSQNPEEFEQCFDSIRKNETVLKYPSFQQKLKEMGNLSQKWAVRFKNELMDKEKEVSSIEMATLVLKDQVYVTKAYNLPQLFRYLSQDLDAYFRLKINHCINNTLDKFILSSYREEMRNIDDLNVTELPTGQYKVQNSKTEKSYFVDAETGMCSCLLGVNGSRCKHQYAVCTSKKVNLHLGQIDINDDVIKKELHWIATNSLNSLFGTMERETTADSDMDYDPIDDEEYDPRRELQPLPKKLGRPKAPKKQATGKEEAKAILDRVVKDIMQRYDSSPQDYHRAIVAMAVNYQSLHYDIPIMNALRNFGKPI